MIHRLKRKFIVLSTAAMILLMCVLLFIMNLVNYRSVVSESDKILDLLSQTEIPVLSDGITPPQKPLDDIKKLIPRDMSPEVPYESRYFSVIVDSEGNIENSDLSRIISVDDSSVSEYIEDAVTSRRERGFADHFRFAKIQENGTTEILFLDCGRKLDAFSTFLWTSIAVGFGGCAVVFLAFLFCAGKIVKPIAESYEKQKRFISDAGHEIKTPLTIINANIDLLEIDGEKEELSDIRMQTERLTKLTNDLVYLSKMEEEAKPKQKVEMPLSEIVTECVGAFHAPAQAGDICLCTEIMPDISYIGSPDAMRQLVFILLDNALKYTPRGGKITLSLWVYKKNLNLMVQNTAKYQINREDLPRLFDRFYRTDTSRNSGTGGHGIGLSIAKAVTESHGGTIGASLPNEGDFQILASFPL